MKIVAVLCNIILFGFTCLVLVTDGRPEGAGYSIFALWMLLTLVLSAAVISHPSAGPLMRIVTILLNIVLLGFIFWALMAQPAHPKEEGFVAYVILLVLTPILSFAALFHGETRDAALAYTAGRR